MNRLTRTAACFVSTILACLALAGTAAAEPSYQDALETKYPNAAKSLAGCIACHPGGNTGAITSFGAAFDAAGRDFTPALEAKDSDGDGFTNLAELTASPATNPGDAASKPAATTPAVNYQGLWWNAAESGWGINFAHQGDIIFATWYTYDASGKPWWLIAELHKSGAGVYTGTVSTVTGPAFSAQPWTGPVVETAVGVMTVTFTGAGSGELAWTVNGKSRSIAVTKQVFGTLPTCTWGAQTNLALATNYTDLWWNAAESGWGINLSHQGDVIFATWFTYDASGKPWWLIAELHKTAAGIYSGDVSTVSGPAYDAVPWAGKVVETVIGTATLTIRDGNSASFNSSVNGVVQTKQITRQVFIAPGTVCQ